LLRRLCDVARNELRLVEALSQYRQFDILVIECISAHVEGFCTRMGASPPVKGQLLTGQLALLRLSFADYYEMQLYRCPDLSVLGFRRKENSQEAKRFFDRCISVDECLSAGLIAPPIESMGVYATSSPLAAG